MTSRRVFFAMTGVVAISAGLFIGGVVLGNQRLTNQAQKLVGLKLEAQVVTAQQTALVQAKKDIEAYSELAVIARTIVPQDKDQARSVLEINKIAEESGIKLQTIAFQSSNLGQAAPPATPSGDEAPSTTPAAPPLTQVKPIEGITGVYSLEMIITPGEGVISYSNFLNFLERLENNRRTAHVSKIAINPLAKGGGLSFTLTLNAYVKP